LERKKQKRKGGDKMIKNNIVAFGIHVLLCIVGGFGSILLLDHSFIQNNKAILMGVEIIWFLLLVLGYITIGKRVLESLGKNSLNILSVSFVSLFIFIIWVICRMLSGNPTGDLTWFIYIVANFDFFGLLSGLNDQYFMLLSLIFSFIPSVCMSLSFYFIDKKRR
jgi:nitrate reductase NapE component